MIAGSPWGPFIGLYVVVSLVGLVYVGRVNPEVLRNRWSSGKGTEAWDWVWRAVLTPVSIAILVVAGYDIHNGWAPLPPWVWPIGVVLFVLGYGLGLRAMAENPFFEATVRIQSERGHYVIDSGPYRTLRHPGYVGGVAVVLSVPLLLNSAWALLPTALAIIGMVIRTALEDRTLQKKLPGYADYAARVRWRLFPGVW